MELVPPWPTQGESTLKCDTGTVKVERWEFWKMRKKKWGECTMKDDAGRGKESKW